MIFMLSICLVSAPTPPGTYWKNMECALVSIHVPKLQVQREGLWLLAGLQRD